MALTKISGSVIKDSVSLSGNVSVGGTLTYQDVTNVDALGVGTFRSGINVSGGQLDVGSNIKIGSAGIITASNFKTGVTNLHSTGLTLTGGQLDVGSNIKVGTAGVITATSFVGSGANLTGINADLVNDTSPQLGGNLDTNSHEISLDTSHAINFGDSNELRVFYHSGNGQIDFNGNTSLQLKTPANKYFQVVNRDNGNNIIQAQAGGAVQIYHNNTLRFETRTNDVKFYDGLVAIDNAQIQLGNSGDLKLYHDGTNSYVDNIITGILRIRGNSSGQVEIQPKGGQYGVTLIPDGATELYHSGTKKFTTTSYGISIGGSSGSISGAAGIEIGNAATSEIRLKNTSGGSAQGDGFGIQKWSDGNTYIYEYDPHNFIIGTNGTSRWIIGGTSGHITPFANNTYDIGSSSSRVRNIYTNDLNLSNKGSTNSVDNTWGDYTIQEGESDLFLINNRSGKKYKFNLTEVL